MSEEKLSKVEIIKKNSRFLRGPLQEELQNDASHFTEEAVQVLKFHGTYQQDDRDLRRELTKQGKERHYIMMIRARIPGGVLSAEQYLVFDRLADEYGNGSMRVTTRQTFQLHGVLKRNLKSTIRRINEALITTLGGCGDQVRNTVGCAHPHQGPFEEAVRRDLLRLVDETSAKTNAYHEIWLDGERVDPEVDGARETLYGETYLPRKFKIGFAYEGDNCSDVYSNDIGIVAHRDGERVAGYTLLIGGGMGRTASDKETHPALAKPFAFVTPDELVDVVKAIITIQRDHGNRENRKFARMKYLVESRGVDWFRDEAERRLGRRLAPPRELVWHSSDDHLGRIEDDDKVHLGLYVENGRIADKPGFPLKSALAAAVAKYRPTVRLTTQQNLILADLAPQDADALEAELAAQGIRLPDAYSPVKLRSMACPAMPTCGLAIAESERVFPKVVERLEALLAELGLADEPITVRMTGCANGCARPYIAEIGFVGRVIGKYDIFLGANVAGTRLNARFREMVPFDDLVPTLRPVLELYRDERLPGERFGDFCHRVGLERLKEAVPVS
ncbi:NADPH-dependent assimilatory sulfite reductase hemoprotein subunit [Alicyclobacillus mali (ex Roth et al. 2021)]|uniref:NADPH-dependent assimilatory sulfite reductase hemoprotein subunit n=1 Tax=Alicyclobacillus mali (ex Roth et al. 2021) TaxID=1123961 RepID=UPI001A8E1F8E